MYIYIYICVYVYIYIYIYNTYMYIIYTYKGGLGVCRLLRALGCLGHIPDVGQPCSCFNYVFRFFLRTAFF